MVGLRSKRLIGWVTATEHRDCGAIESCQALCESWPTRGVAIFVPPTVFEKKVAIFDLPMIADMGQQLGGRDPLRIEAGQKVATVVRHDLAIGSEQVAVNAQPDSAAREFQFFANIVCVVQRQPQPATIFQRPLFSCVSAAGGRCSALPKQQSKTSRTSAWLALTWNR